MLPFFAQCHLFSEIGNRTIDLNPLGNSPYVLGKVVVESVVTGYFDTELEIGLPIWVK
jgi:hypothetical protein